MGKCLPWKGGFKSPGRSVILEAFGKTVDMNHDILRIHLLVARERLWEAGTDRDV